jgi:hypothetical protein
MTCLPIAVLVDETLKQGRLWLEDGRVMVELPAEAKWLFDELRRRKEEVRRECEQRWCQPGIPAADWFAQHEDTTRQSQPARPTRRLMPSGGVR